MEHYQPHACRLDKRTGIAGAAKQVQVATEFPGETTITSLSGGVSGRFVCFWFPHKPLNFPVQVLVGKHLGK